MLRHLLADAWSWQSSGGVDFLALPLAVGSSSAYAYFSSRIGGVSEPPYDQLNLSWSVGDDAENVEMNRRRFAGALGLAVDAIIWLRQVHSDQAVIIDSLPFRYSYTYTGGEVLVGDALITDQEGTGLCTSHADCVPVYVVDPVRHVGAMIHAGWRGTVAGIVEKTLAAMAARWGSEPKDCIAAIGPSIGPCCYQVGAEVVSALAKNVPSPVKAFDKAAAKNQSSDRYSLDLKLIIAGILQFYGLEPDRIIQSRLCTSCLPEWFYSHRRDKGKTGRMAAVLVLGT
ncbi:MAG: peptidoglycan editing factor PgeF [Clostridia bacterium]|nr:peptidoglycan editing factor PgeF [Clostridia bacterium]